MVTPDWLQGFLSSLTIWPRNPLLGWYIAIALVLLGLGAGAFAVVVVRRHPWWGTAALLVLFPAAWALQAGGFVYSRELLGLVVAVLVLILVAVALRGFWQGNTQVPSQPEVTRQPGDRYNLPAALVGLVVAALTISQYLVPIGTGGAANADCENIAVRGSATKILTSGVGQNVRAGPDDLSRIAAHFAANCVLGVDGYCVGTQVMDPVVGLPDVRWLRLRFTSSYVAAARVTFISPLGALAGGAETTCGVSHSEPVFNRPVTLTFSGATKNLYVKSSPRRTTLYGVAVGVPADDSSIEALRVGSAPRLVPATADDAERRVSLSDLGHRLPAKAAIIVAVVPCLAAEVPSSKGTNFFMIEPGAKEPPTSALVLHGAPEGTAERLRQAACEIDPGATANSLAVEANKTDVKIVQ